MTSPDGLVSMVEKEKKDFSKMSHFSKLFMNSTPSKDPWSVTSKAKVLFEYFMVGFQQAAKSMDPGKMDPFIPLMARIANNAECLDAISKSKEFFTVIEQILKMRDKPGLCYKALGLLYTILSISLDFVDFEKVIRRIWVQAGKIYPSVPALVQEYTSISLVHPDAMDDEVLKRMNVIERSLTIIQYMLDTTRCLNRTSVEVFEQVQKSLPIRNLYQLASSLNPQLAISTCSFLTAIKDSMSRSQVTDFRKMARANKIDPLLRLLVFVLHGGETSKIVKRREAARNLLGLLLNDKEGLGFLKRVFPTIFVDVLFLKRKVSGVGAKPASAKSTANQATSLMNDFTAWGKKQGQIICQGLHGYVTEETYAWDLFWGYVDGEFNRAQVVWNQDIRLTTLSIIQKEITWCADNADYTFSSFPKLTDMYLPAPRIGEASVSLLRRELQIVDEMNLDNAKTELNKNGSLPFKIGEGSPIYFHDYMAVLDALFVLITSHDQPMEDLHEILKYSAKQHPSDLYNIPNITMKLISVSRLGPDYLLTSLHILNHLIRYAQSAQKDITVPLPKFLETMMIDDGIEMLKRGLLTDASCTVECLDMIFYLLTTLKRASYHVLEPGFFVYVAQAVARFGESDQFENIIPTYVKIIQILKDLVPSVEKSLYAYGVFEVCFVYLLNGGMKSRFVAEYLKEIYAVQNATVCVGNAYMDAFFPKPIVNLLIDGKIGEFLSAIVDDDIRKPELLWNSSMRYAALSVLRDSIQKWCMIADENGGAISFLKFTSILNQQARNSTVEGEKLREQESVVSAPVEQFQADETCEITDREEGEDHNDDEVITNDNEEQEAVEKVAEDDQAGSELPSSSTRPATATNESGPLSAREQSERAERMVPQSPSNEPINLPLEDYFIPFGEEQIALETVFPPLYPDAPDRDYTFVGLVYVEIFNEMPEAPLRDPGLFLRSLIQVLCPESPLFLDAIYNLYKYHGGKETKVDQYLGWPKFRNIAQKCEKSSLENLVRAIIEIIGHPVVEQNAHQFPLHPVNFVNAIQENMLQVLLGRCLKEKVFDLFMSLYDHVSAAAKTLMSFKNFEKVMNDTVVDKILICSHMILVGIEPNSNESRMKAINLVSQLGNTFHGISTIISLRTIVFALQGITDPKSFLTSSEPTEEEQKPIQITSSLLLLRVIFSSSENSKQFLSLFPLATLKNFSVDIAESLLSFLTTETLTPICVWDSNMYSELCSRISEFVKILNEASLSKITSDWLLEAHPEIPDFIEELPQLDITYGRFEWEPIIDEIVVRGYAEEPEGILSIPEKHAQWTTHLFLAERLQISNDLGKDIGEATVFSNPPEQYDIARHVLIRGLSTALEQSRSTSKVILEDENFGSILNWCANEDLYIVYQSLSCLYAISRVAGPEFIDRIFPTMWIVLSNSVGRIFRETPTGENAQREYGIISGVLMMFGAAMTSPRAQRITETILERGFLHLVLKLLLRIVSIVTLEPQPQLEPILERCIQFCAMTMASLEMTSGRQQGQKVHRLLESLVCMQFANKISQLAKGTAIGSLTTDPDTPAPETVKATCETVQKLLFTDYVFEPIHYWSSEMCQENIEFISSLIGPTEVKLVAMFESDELPELDNWPTERIDWVTVGMTYQSEAFKRELMIKPGVFPRAFLDQPHSRGYDQAQFFDGLCEDFVGRSRDLMTELIGCSDYGSVCRTSEFLNTEVDSLSCLLQASPEWILTHMNQQLIGHIVQTATILSCIASPEFLEARSAHDPIFEVISRPPTFDQSELAPLRISINKLINHLIVNQETAVPFRSTEIIGLFSYLLLSSPSERELAPAVNAVKLLVVNGKSKDVLPVLAQTGLQGVIVWLALNDKFSENIRIIAIETLSLVIFNCPQAEESLNSCLPQSLMKTFVQTSEKVYEYIQTTMDKTEKKNLMQALWVSLTGLSIPRPGSIGTGSPLDLIHWDTSIVAEQFEKLSQQTE